MKRLSIAILSLWLALAPAYAQVGGLSFPGPGPRVASAGSFSLTAQGSSGVAAPGGTAVVNYGTVSYGSGCNAVLIGVWWYGSAAGDVISSISFGGSAATQVPGVYVGGSNIIDLWQFNSPAGTSANITVTFSGIVTFNSNVTVYCLTSAHTTVSSANNSGLFATACGTGTPTSAGSVTVPSGGGAVALGANQNGAVLTFTNATSDGVYTGGGVQDRWGHTTSTGATVVSVTPGATDTCSAGVAAYGP